MGEKGTEMGEINAGLPKLPQVENLVTVSLKSLAYTGVGGNMFNVPQTESVMRMMAAVSGFLPTELIVEPITRASLKGVSSFADLARIRWSEFDHEAYLWAMKPVVGVVLFADLISNLNRFQGIVLGVGDGNTCAVCGKKQMTYYEGRIKQVFSDGCDDQSCYSHDLIRGLCGDWRPPTHAEIILAHHDVTSGHAEIKRADEHAVNSLKVFE